MMDDGESEAVCEMMGDGEREAGATVKIFTDSFRK